MMRSQIRVAGAVIISALAIALTPVAATADPPAAPSEQPCTTASLADLNRRVTDLNNRIAAHNLEQVDQTNAGAVAQYNAQADDLERQRADMTKQIAACQRSLAENPAGTGNPTAPTSGVGPASPEAPPIDNGITSRGSAPLFVWVATSAGSISDESGMVSAPLAYQTAHGYGIPDAVVGPGTFAPYRGRTISDVITQYVDRTTGRWKWPANHGFVDDHFIIGSRFVSGMHLDGFLDTDPDSGIFEAGTRYEERALPPGTIGPYVEAIGTGKRMPANYRMLINTAGSAFGMKGGAMKNLVINTDTGQVVPIAALLAEGYLAKTR